MTSIWFFVAAFVMHGYVCSQRHSLHYHRQLGTFTLIGVGFTLWGPELFRHNILTLAAFWLHVFMATYTVMVGLRERDAELRRTHWHAMREAEKRLPVESTRRIGTYTMRQYDEFRMDLEALGPKLWEYCLPQFIIEQRIQSALKEMRRSGRVRLFGYRMDALDAYESAWNKSL